MIVINNSEPLFDAFTAAGLNVQQVLQDAAAIVQNSGVELTEAQVDEWGVSVTKKLTEQHRIQMQLITDVHKAIKEMKQ